MPKLTIVLPLLAAVIIISGCTGPTTGSGMGVVFDAFEADFYDGFVNEPISLTVKVSNQGTVDSTDGEIFLVGIEDKYIEQGPDQDPRCKWDRLQGLDPVYGTVGEERLCQMTLKFEEGEVTIPQGLSTQFQPIARLYYLYQTETIKTIPVMSQAELRRLQTTGEGIPLEFSTTTGGPVSLDIRTKGPIRFFEDSDVIIPIEIDITNVGGGTTVTGHIDTTSDWNKVALDLEGLQNAGITITDGCEHGQEVSLYRGQTATLVCNARIKVNDIIGPLQKNLMVRVVYYYFEDRSITINVHDRTTR